MPDTQSTPTPHPAVYRPLWTAHQRRAVRGVLMVERAARAASNAEAAAVLAHRAANTRRTLNADAAAIWLTHAARAVATSNPAASSLLLRLAVRLEQAEDERRALATRSAYAPERAPWRHFHELHPASVASRANASWAPTRAAGTAADDVRQPVREADGTLRDTTRKAAGIKPRARRVR